MSLLVESLEKLSGYVFDLDGTVYLGDQALPGAVDLIRKLRNFGMKVLFVTNKPLQPREQYAQKLTNLGLPTDPADIITSGHVLGYYLSRNAPQLGLYVVGEENLKSELRSHGLFVLGEFSTQDARDVISPDGVDAVVVSFDRTIDYRKLNTAYQALMRGAAFYATNADRFCPMPGGGIPDAGGIIAALECMTGRKLELLAGKPSRLMLEVAMGRMGLPPEKCIVFGDRLETDIRMGHEAGMQTALVLTGDTTKDKVESADPRPDIVFENLERVLSLLPQN